MFYVYKITNKSNGKWYIGYTNNIESRWNSHTHASKNKNTPLYNSMRKHGINNFSVEVLHIYENKQDAVSKEIALIDTLNPMCYNLAKGGEGGYVIPESKREGWLLKLSDKRQGRQPALGMKHTKENRDLFSECGKKRWDACGRYPDVSHLSFKEAREQFGISKTHYYRLKRVKSNDLN